MSGLDAGVVGVVHRSHRNRGGVSATADVDLPAAGRKIRGVDRLAGLHHDQADSTTEGKTVRCGTHVPDRAVVAVNDFGVEHQRLRVVDEYLDEPTGNRASGLLGNDGVAPDETV